MQESGLIWNHTIDMHFKYLGPLFCFFYLESPSGAALGVAVVAGGLMTITSFVTDMIGNIFVYIDDLNMDSTSPDVQNMILGAFLQS